MSILDMSLTELDETLASAGRPSSRHGGAYSIFDGTPIAAPVFDTPPPTNMAASGVGRDGRAVLPGAYAAPLHAGLTPARAVADRPPEYTGKGRSTTIRLSSYDGTTPLETHLAKLDICADYYSRTAYDRL